VSVQILSGACVRDVLPLPIDEVLMLLEVFHAGWLVDEIPRCSTGWAGKLGFREEES
jgi:hypothetical protein